MVRPHWVGLPNSRAGLEYRILSLLDTLDGGGGRGQPVVGLFVAHPCTRRRQFPRQGCPSAGITGKGEIDAAIDAGPFKGFIGSSQSTNRTGIFSSPFHPPHSSDNLTDHLRTVAVFPSQSAAIPGSRHPPEVSSLLKCDTLRWGLMVRFKHFPTTSVSHKPSQNSSRKLATRLHYTSVVPVDPRVHPDARPKRARPSTTILDHQRPLRADQTTGRREVCFGAKSR